MGNIKYMDYKKIDFQISKIARKVNLISALGPKNLKQEKERFFNSQNYNPQFSYKKPILDFNELQKKLKTLNIDNSSLGVIFKRKRRELFKKITLLENLGKPSFTKLSSDLYGRPGRKFLKRAKEHLARRPQFISRSKTFRAQEAKRYFEKVLKDYNLNRRWKVKLKKNLVPDCYIAGSRMNVRSIVKFSKERMARTVAHEIETHVLRGENGKRQPYRIFSEGLADYISTEEGLAIYNEEQVAKKSSRKSFWPALYVLAVDKALVSSFRDVFDAIISYGFSKERAWVIACKVKRGLRDTSLPGGFTKDWLYLAGKYRIEDYLKRGGDLKRLYLGKVGIEDLPLIEKIPNLKEPKYLPTFLNISRKL